MKQKQLSAMEEKVLRGATLLRELKSILRQVNERTMLPGEALARIDRRVATCAREEYVFGPETLDLLKTLDTRFL